MTSRGSSLAALRRQVANRQIGIAAFHYLHSHCGAQGTTLAELCLPQMETPDQYREYAAECFRLASKSKTEADRKTLLELVRAWKKVAEEAA
jgi:hypothetical protein